MNLSELNESGKDVRVFLTTAIVALVITGASWFFIEEFNNYLKWKRSHAARTQGNRSLNARMQLPLGARIGMLALLWHYGHKSWMWRSGAWWRILTNNSSGLSQGTQAKGPSACEYVWEHTVGSRFPRDEAFKPDVIYEWKK